MRLMMPRPATLATAFAAIAACVLATTARPGLAQNATQDRPWTIQPDWRGMQNVQVSNRIARRSESVPKQQPDEAIVLEGETVQGPQYQTSGTGEPLASMLHGETDESAGGEKFVDYLIAGHWNFDVVTPGTYRVHLRVWIPKDAGWNFQISFGEQDAAEVRIPRGTAAVREWFWVEAQTIDLKKGTHRLFVNQLMGGKRLDRIVIQPVDETAPTGIGPATTPLESARTGQLISPLLAIPDQVRWRATEAARTAGLQSRVRYEDPWVDVDDQWHDGTAMFRLPLDQAPIRIDHVRIELDWPADRTAIVDAGAGRLAFDLPTGRLVAILDSATRVTTLASQPIFDVRWWNEDRTEKIGSEPDRWIWQSDASSDSQWVYHHADTNATLTIQPEAKDGELLLHADLNNAGDELIGEFAFPRLPAITVPDSDHSIFTWPTPRPSLITSPEAHSGGEIPYPRGAMNFLAYTDKTTGFYVATYDPDARFNLLAFDGNRTATGLEMSHTLFDEIKPGEVDKRTISLAVLDGDWRAGSDLYRTWFYQTHGKADLPRWITHGVGWVANFIHHDRPVAFHGGRDIQIDTPWWFGTDHFQIWGHGPILTCCPNYYYPDPGRGGEAEFKKFIATLHRYGLRTGTYFHGHAINPYFTVADGFRGIDKDSLPPELQPPSHEWYEKYRNIPEPNAPAFEIDPKAVDIVENQGGGVETYGRFPRVFRDLNWGPEYRNYISFWVNRYLTQYKTQIPYLDVWSFRPKHLEYNPLIGFGDGRQAQRMKIFYDWLVERGREVVGDDFAFTFEGYTDIWSRHGIGMLSNFRRQPELIRYTFPDHVIVEGTNNGHWNVPDDLIALGRSFADGNYLDIVIPRSSRSRFFWMKDALRFWIGETDYKYTDGIVKAPDSWMVRHHLAENFGLWLWFDMAQNPGSLVLETDAAGNRPIRWYAIDDSGNMRHLDQQGNRAVVDFDAGSHIGAVLAIWGDDLPHDYITYITTTPNIDEVQQQIVAMNVSTSTIELPITLTDFDAPDDAPLASTAFTLSPGQAAEQTLSIPVSDRTIRTFVQVGDEDQPRRRLSPAPIDDPYLQHARRAAEQVQHPEDPDRYALHNFVKRRIYWPANVKGKVTIRYKQAGSSHMRAYLKDLLTDESASERHIRNRGDETQDQWTTVELPFHTPRQWLELRIVERADEDEGEFWVDRIVVERDDDSQAARP